MKRRSFLAAGLGGAVGAPAQATPPSPMKLAGLTASELQERYRKELFDVQLPFWERSGVDHEHGGFMCALDFDGRRVNTNKFHWFQGRGIWVYSFLYNNFGKNPAHLEVARKSKEFLLKYAPQSEGRWAEVLSRQGGVMAPSRGDVYGILFGAEGLQEYARAARDEQARDTAFSLLRQIFRRSQKPDFRMADGEEPGVRPQGLWMVMLRIATQALRRWKDPEIEEIARRSVDAVIHRHFNPDTGLNTELLRFDFSRLPEPARHTVIGHSIETLWMIMDEADRVGDHKLRQTCAERIRRHFEVGWDPVYGGLVEAVNVDAGCYQWPEERPVGTDLVFRSTGEHLYLKTLWSHNEALIAMLKVLEGAPADWALRCFDMSQRLIDEKFSLRKKGLPGYLLFCDRRFSPQPHGSRQDNYHPLRQLMLSILLLDRLGGARATEPRL
jgi:mannose/cellobiose epimerase-like protein (N-acyl-D-glucosamine 2-epimerase family)